MRTNTRTLPDIDDVLQNFGLEVRQALNLLIVLTAPGRRATRRRLARLRRVVRGRRHHRRRQHRPHHLPGQPPGRNPQDPDRDLHCLTQPPTRFASPSRASPVMPEPSSRGFCCIIRVSSTPPIFLGREGAEETPRLIDLHPVLSGVPNADAAEVVPFSWDALTNERRRTSSSSPCLTSSRATSRPSHSRTASASSIFPPPGACSTRRTAPSTSSRRQP